MTKLAQRSSEEPSAGSGQPGSTTSSTYATAEPNLIGLPRDSNGDLALIALGLYCRPGRYIANAPMRTLNGLPLTTP